MDLSEYTIYEAVAGLMILTHRPTGEILIKTQQISLDTMLRLAVVHNAKLNRISL